MGHSLEDREEHFAWALVGLGKFLKALDRYENTNDPGALISAFKHAYGVEINLLDAGEKNLAEQWKPIRTGLAQDLREKMLSKTAKKTPPKDPKGHKWKKLPKGWTDESRKKFWDSLTSRAPKHKVTQCIKRMEGKVSNPGAFCASLADRVIPGWRQEAAKERKKKNKKAFLELQRVAVSLRQPLRTRRDYEEKKREEEEKEGKASHSQMPGVDNLTFETDHKVASQWITRAEMKELCPPCAVRMKKANLSRVHVSVVRKMLRRQVSVT